MIIFIDLGNQIYPYSDEKSFSFFCTITDQFKNFNGCETWNSIEDFIEDYDNENEDIQRYLNQIPDDFK